MVEKSSICGKGIWNIKIWITIGILFLLLAQLDDKMIRSPFWFFEIFLYGNMILGIWANDKYDIRKKIKIPRKIAPLVFIFLVWAFGMIYEMSLTVNGSGIGGLHKDTFTSFILAQGDYIAIAFASFFIIRYLRLSFKDVYFLAGGKSLTEGLIFTGVLLMTLLSPFFFLSPFILGYYTLVYASFIALPLLYVDEELLWKEKAVYKKHSILLMWLLGFIVAFGIRLFWGLVYGPIVTKIFNL